MIVKEMYLLDTLHSVYHSIVDTYCLNCEFALKSVIKTWPCHHNTFDFGRVPEAVLMSSQAGRACFKIAQVELKELSELRHIHHFTVGKPSRSRRQKLDTADFTVLVGAQTVIQSILMFSHL